MLVHKTVQDIGLHANYNRTSHIRYLEVKHSHNMDQSWSHAILELANTRRSTTAEYTQRSKNDHVPETIPTT